MIHVWMSYGITNKFLNPIMGVDLEQNVLTPYVVRWVGLVLSFLKMYDSCMLVLCYLKEIY